MSWPSKELHNTAISFFISYFLHHICKVLVKLQQQTAAKLVKFYHYIYYKHVILQACVSIYQGQYVCPHFVQMFLLSQKCLFDLTEDIPTRLVLTCLKVCHTRKRHPSVTMATALPWQLHSNNNYHTTIYSSHPYMLFCD